MSLNGAALKTPNGVIYVCQPSYGGGNKDSKRQFWGKAFSPNGPYSAWPSVFDDKGGSILAGAFNTHWCQALNSQLAGQPITRFVMCHDDIVPEDFWVEKLLTILDRTGGDLVSAVAPIKDVRCLSSTAIDDPDDVWEVYRRLTMYEVGLLPPTFSAEDCKKQFGYECEKSLLVNTGCWACDFTKPWRNKVYFNISSRIVFVLEGTKVIPMEDYRYGMIGAFVNQDMPEDWSFSRQLAKLGAKVFATRELSLKHIGEAPFNNQDTTFTDDGMQWKTDEHLRRKFDPTWKDIVIADGWLTENEGRFLANLAEGKRVLEIGSYCGLSTVWMARKATSVFCVDTFDSRGTICQGDTLYKFMNTLSRYKITNVGFARSTSEKLLDGQAEVDNSYDVAFVDGDHSADFVKKDLMLCAKMLTADSVIALHDYSGLRGHKSLDPDVARVVDDFIQMGYLEKAQQGRCDSIITVRPTKRFFAEFKPKEHNNGKRQKASTATAELATS